MTIGAILTLGLGAYSDVNHLVTLGYGTGGAPAPTPPTPPPAAPQANSGGYFYGRRRTPEDVKRARERFGLREEVAAIVADVAVEAVEQDYSQEAAVAELEQELAAVRLDVKEIYVRALRQQIESLREEVAAHEARQTELITIFALSLD